MNNELLMAFEDYIKLLGDELNEIVGIASVHGWKSSRYGKGVECRKRIEDAKARPEPPQDRVEAIAKYLYNLHPDYGEDGVLT